MIQKSPGVSRRKLGHRNDHQPRLNMCHQVQSALRLGAGGGAGTVLCTLPRGMRRVACSAWKVTASVLYYENFLPSSMRPIPQLVQGSGTSRISRRSLLERKIISFKSE